MILYYAQLHINAISQSFVEENAFELRDRRLTMDSKTKNYDIRILKLKMEALWADDHEVITTEKSLIVNSKLCMYNKYK